MTSPLYVTPNVGLLFGSQLFVNNPMYLGAGVIGRDSILESYYGVSVTGDATAIDIRRGRDRLLDTYNAGNATVTFRDTSALFAPTRTASPISGLVWTGAQLRVEAVDATVAIDVPLSSTAVVSCTYDKNKHIGQSDLDQFDVRVAYTADDIIDSKRQLVFLGEVGKTSYDFTIRNTAGVRRLFFQFTFDGVSYGTKAYEWMSDPLPFIDSGETLVVRADWQPSTPAINFYYCFSTPERVKTQANSETGWVYCGSNVSYAGGTLATDLTTYTSWAVPGSGSTANVQVGAYSATQAWSDCTLNLEGDIRAFVLKMAGTTTDSFDVDNMTVGASTLTSNQSTTYTVRGDADIELSNYTYHLFRGFIQGFSYEWGQGQPGCYVTVTAEDAFRLLNLASVETVTGAAALDSCGDRITQVLSTINYPTLATLIDDGDTVLQDDDGTVRSALSAIQTVEQSDLGAFYCDGQGRLNYVGRSALNERLASYAQVFSDSSVGVYPSYRQIRVQYDDELISNQASITPAGSTAQVASDGTSITKYFLREFSRSGLIMDADVDAEYMAQTIVAGRSEPSARIESVGFDITANVDTWATVVGLDLNYPVGLSKDWVQDDSVIIAGGVVSLGQRLGVQGIAHSIRPDRWVTVLSTAEQLVDGFILDSAEWGTLDLDTISY
jgi:hypothetical protein